MKSNPSKKAVLHITPHLGGGVGRVLLNYLEQSHGNPEVENLVVSLEYANDSALAALQEIGISVRDKMSEDHDGVIVAIAGADAVIVHFWNHPLLYDFLVRKQVPPCRMASVSPRRQHFISSVPSGWSRPIRLRGWLPRNVK